jgi:hypothetical protein
MTYIPGMRAVWISKSAGWVWVLNADDHQPEEAKEKFYHQDQLMVVEPHNNE